MTYVHLVVPEGIDDPARPSGGNIYDRRLCDGLTAAGRRVSLHAIPGAWPCPDSVATAALERRLAQLPERAVVLIDGLIASAVPQVLTPQSRRLRIVPLVHMPLGMGASANGARSREHEVLRSAAAVITTSEWSRRTLLELYGLPGERVHVAEPGVAPAVPAQGTPGGGELLCVAAVIAAKGYDVLVDALANVTGEWRCTCVGTVERDPAFVAQLRQRIYDHGLESRVRLTGALSGSALTQRYRAADLLVHASLGETYGMVVAEALAAGLPVVATDVGGIPATLGVDGSGVRPGLLVAPGDSAALGEALQAWLDDVELRQRLRRAALGRRASLAGWPATTSAVAGVLSEVAR